MLTNRLSLSTALPAVLLTFVGIACLPASATPEEDANELLPLENRNLSIEADSRRLESAAEAINATTGSPQKNASDTPEDSLVDDLMDGDGGVNLPLGITVFSTLGDPSIGFGSDL